MLVIDSEKDRLKGSVTLPSVVLSVFLPVGIKIRGHFENYFQKNRKEKGKNEKKKKSVRSGELDI